MNRKKITQKIFLKKKKFPVFISRIFLSFVIGILTILVVKPYFNQGFPYTHDGENHLARFANYKIAVKEGQIPPRFAPNLMNHYGYPVFNYNYPLANIVSLPFSALKINYEITFKAMVASSVFLGLLGMYIWLNHFSLSIQSRLFAITTFAVTPYLASTIIFRGNIGEVMAWGLFPWMVWLIDRIVEQKEIKNNKFHLSIAVIIYSLFLLSHNIIAFFGSIVLGIYAIVVTRNNRKLFLTFGWIVLFSISLTMWFWLPAITEKSSIILDNAKLSNTYLNHFPTFNQLLFSPFTFGFSYASPIDTLTFRVGITQIAIYFLSFFFLGKIIIHKKTNRVKHFSTLGFIFALTGLSLFLQLSISAFIWKNLPLVNFIQFPWRMSFFFSIFIIPLCAYIFENAKKPLKIILLLLLFFQIVIFLKVKPVDFFHKTNRDYDAFSQSTSTLNENLPKGFTYLNIGDWQPAPSVLEGEATISNIEWSGSNRTYTLDVKKPSIIVEPTMNFLGWQTSVIQQDQSLSDKVNRTGFNHQNVVQYLGNELTQGRIGYMLDPGLYDVRTQFTQKTWSRLIGNSISLISGLVFLLITILSVYKTYLQNNDNS